MNKIQLFLGKHTTKLVGPGKFNELDNLLLVSSDEYERGLKSVVNDLTNWGLANRASTIMMVGQQQWKKREKYELKRYQHTSFGNKQS